MDATTETWTGDRPNDRSYRVYGRIAATAGCERTANRFLLVDIDSDRTRWVRPAAEWTGEPRPMWPGTVLDGTVEREGEGLATLRNATVRERTTLALVETDQSLPERVWEVWADRGPSAQRVTGVLPADADTPHCEVHVSAPPSGVDAATLWRRMLAGQYSFEPWFDRLVELDGPAAHLTVVNPADAEVFVFFATPAATPVATVRERRSRLGHEVFPDSG